ncbi:uncharacterized protein LOC107798645 [Nicotiana tabacum]|uniref:Uncharacterized protein LOC107798645 n=1 Tax=Nicotiana tabacum TaxID=4097 RepID=A0A1S4AKC3_TOBAC|nr:PREDICTED: uncharacterized protein LOC107798645 [Nicotiana tabacum]
MPSTGSTKKHGHKIEDRIALRLEATNLLQQGHLKELLSDKDRNTLVRCQECPGPPKPPSPTHTINMIIGGSDDASVNGIKFTTTHKLKRLITHEWHAGLEESSIFTELAADERIMVDDGSGACIIHPRVLAQMGLKDKIVPHCITLTGFNNAVEWTSGEIKLPVLTGGVTLEITFHIMSQDTTYNVIVGRS